MLVAAFLFATMNALIKLATLEHSLSQIVFYRGFPSLILLGVWLFAYKKTLLNSNWLSHVLRNGFGMISMWLGFYAMQHLPLATATTLNYTSPLFITLILIFSAQSKTMGMQWAAIVFGFCGVIFVLQPTLASNQVLFAFIGLLAGLSSAFAYLQIKDLGRLGEPEWRTVFFFSACSSLTGYLAANIQNQSVLPHSASSAALLFGIGITGAIGQITLTRAFGKGCTWLSASLQYAIIPFSLLIGEMLWNDKIDFLSMVGMVLIFFCSCLSAWITAKKAKP